MENNDLTPENLMNKGLTKDIFENNLKKWYKENRDISADFENDKVLIDKINTSNEVANVFEMLKNNFLSNGYDLDGFNQLVSEQTKLTKINFDDNLKKLPDDFRAEFLSDFETESKQKLIEIKKSLFNDLKNKILNSDDLFIKKNKPLVISKNEFIQKITKAEILAKDAFKVSINQDLFSIENQKINEEHHQKLLNKYYAETLKSYNSVANLYKVSNNQFAFIDKESGNKLTQEDRIDFIATILLDYLTNINNENNNNVDDKSKDILSQLENIDTLIFETKLLELKAEAIKKFINDRENKVIKKQEEKNNVNNNVIQVISIKKENPYPKIFKDYEAYLTFEKLFNEFKNTTENLSNYSYVFHKMTYDGLMHFDLKQSSYFEFLDRFDIIISRIKPLTDIGKKAFRESIYIGAK